MKCLTDLVCFSWNSMTLLVGRPRVITVHPATACAAREVPES